MHVVSSMTTMAARAHHGARLDERVVIDGQVHQAGRDAPPRRASGLDGLERLPVLWVRRRCR